MPRLSTSRKKPRSRQAPPQVLLRGLSVLEALNRRPVSSVEQIAGETGLPKSTAVRVLQMLVEKDYAECLPYRRGYRLGERVLALSSGYRSIDAIVEIARPILARFTAEHKWPVALATLDVDTMRVRAGTLQESPFSTSIDQSRMARRMPILASAFGLAYLAFCPPDERGTILRLLRASKRPVDGPARAGEALDLQLGAITRQGFALSPAMRGEPAHGCAIPVMAGTQVLACISLRYLGKAITDRQVERRFLAPLKIVAAEIAAGYTAHVPGSRTND